ncbi:MAG TPA: helix-turn-helix transcriptional regulator [Ktedonobacteraceae bacterium]|jgi:transcriptional regulator with XRE-family HTH domain|nr:helix-turn-helix transcriptional regulator [Ktedonobacteraceae bacterium]
MRDRVLARQLGSLIRGLRVKQGMSQEEFADHCSLHRTYIGSIERGEKTITIETAYKIAQALGMPLSQLFRRLEMEQSSNGDNRS